MTITGIMVYYYFVCQRKLWYFCSGITLEQFNEDVAIGRMIDQESYQKERKHLGIRNTINIDFVKEKKEIHEIKKSRSIEEASINQVKYYLWFLEQLGVSGIRGVIDYPLLKVRKEVELETTDYGWMEAVLEDIHQIRNECTPRPFVRMKICKKCAYYDLCAL